MKDMNVNGLTLGGAFVDGRGFHFKLEAETIANVNILSKLVRASLRPIEADGAIYENYAYAWFTIPLTKEMPNNLEFTNRRHP